MILKLIRKIGAPFKVREANRHVSKERVLAVAGTSY